MDVANLVLTCILVALTLVVVIVAWLTVKESKKATDAMKKTVSTLETLLTITRDTATASQASAQAARETVEIAGAAREADQRYRQLAQLREIGRSVQRILVSALQAMDSDLSVSTESMTPYLAQARWRSAEQNMLGVLLVGVEPPLPQCKALVGESQAGQVITAARAADAELAAVFHDLGANY